MQDKNFSGRTFFTELAINLFVFALLCGALATVFSKTLESSHRLREEQLAIAETEYMLAQLEYGNVLFEADNNEENMFFYYADDWSKTDKKDSSYFISLGQAVHHGAAGQLFEYTATAFRADNSEIHSIKVLVYAPSRQEKTDE